MRMKGSDISLDWTYRKSQQVQYSELDVAFPVRFVSMVFLQGVMVRAFFKKREIN
jgi:hypothetical protein